MGITKKSPSSILNLNRLFAWEKQIPKFVLLGILGVVLMYIGVAGTVSVTSPWWLGRGDAPRHIDYAWRVYNKQLPNFIDGLQQKDLNVLRKNLYRNQPAASNPPLFYIIHAPFIGPSLKSGQWQKAVAIGRTLNIFIGVLCVLALAWGGWVFGGGDRKRAFALAVPALAVMTHAFTTLNLNYAVDVLLVLLSTLTLITIHKIISKGLKPGYLIWLTFLSVAGMATKVTYLPFLLLSFICILIASFISGSIKSKEQKARQLIIALCICMAVAIVVILAIGWFYYFHNYKISGSFASAIPPNGYPSRRPYKTAYDVITGSGLWRLLYSHYSSVSALSVSLVSFVIAGSIASLDRLKYKDVLRSKRQFIALLFLAGAYVGMFLIQIKFAIGTGSYSFRYLIPALLPLSLFFAYGLLEARKTRGQAVVFFAAALGYSTIFSRANSSATTVLSFPSIPELYRSLKQLPEMVYANGLPRSLLVALLTSFVIGTILLSLSIYRLTGKAESKVEIKSP